MMPGIISLHQFNYFFLNKKVHFSQVESTICNGAYKARFQLMIVNWNFQVAKASQSTGNKNGETL